MDKKRCFISSSAFVIVTFFFYLTFTNQHDSLIESWSKPFVNIFAPLDTGRPSDNGVDEAENVTSNNTAPSFRARVSEYYPRIPIHIYTQNIPNESNTSKLILLGNGFFGVRNWDGALAGKTSTKISKILHSNILFTLECRLFQ